MRRNYRPNLFGFGGKKSSEPKSVKPRTVVRDGQWHYVYGKERERGLDRGMTMGESKEYAEQKADEDWHARDGKMAWNPGLPVARRETHGLPPRPRSRPPTTRQRLARMSQEYEEEERPFHPERSPARQTRSHHFSVNQPPGAAALREAQSAPARTKRILAAAAEKTRHPEVRAMILEDRGGQWSQAVHDAELLSERVGGAPMTRQELENYVASIVRLEALDSVLGRTRRYGQNPPRGGPVDEVALEALELWIDNTSDLSPHGPSGRGRATVVNLMRKVSRDTYDPDQAPQLWMYLVDASAKDYVKHDEERRPWNVKFNVATRRALAERYARQFEQEVEAGEWDDLDLRIGR